MPAILLVGYMQKSKLSSKFNNLKFFLKSSFKKKNLIMTAVATAIAVFFYAKGHKLTTTFAGVATFFGMFSVNEWGVIVGIFLGVASFILTWIYKHKYLIALRKGASAKALKDGIE